MGVDLLTDCPLSRLWADPAKLIASLTDLRSVGQAAEATEERGIARLQATSRIYHRCRYTCADRGRATSELGHTRTKTRARWASPLPLRSVPDEKINHFNPVGSCRFCCKSPLPSAANTDSVATPHGVAGVCHDGAVEERSGTAVYSFCLEEVVPDDHLVAVSRRFSICRGYMRSWRLTTPRSVGPRSIRCS